MRCRLEDTVVALFSTKIAALFLNVVFLVNETSLVMFALTLAHTLGDLSVVESNSVTFCRLSSCHFIRVQTILSTTLKTWHSDTSNRRKS